MTKFAKEQIKKFFNTGQWALKLIFIVVLCELGIVMGAMVGLAGDCLLYTSPSPRDS